MARIHFWQYLVDGSGVPIEDARIYFYLAGTNTHAYFSVTEASTPTTSDVTEISTDSNGYFHFYVLDKIASESYGYLASQRFKIAWEKNGITPGAVDLVEILDIENDQFLTKTGNLSEITNPATARTNLQLPTYYLQVANNLSDVADIETARNNLGIGGNFLQIALNLSDVANAATARTNLELPTYYLQRANNLSDLANAAIARANLQLPTYYLQVANNLNDLADATISFDNVAPMSALGDLIYGGIAGTGTRLPGNTLVDKRILTQTGDGAASAIPVWDVLESSDIYSALEVALESPPDIGSVTPSAGFFTEITATNAELETVIISGGDICRLSPELQVYSFYDLDDEWERIGIYGLRGESFNLTVESSGTGVDDLDLVLTPAGTGKIKLRNHTVSRLQTMTVTSSASDTILTEDDVQNAVVFISGDDNITFELPASGSDLDGAMIKFMATEAVPYHIKPADVDTIVLSGVALTGGNKISSDGALDTCVTLIFDYTGQCWRTADIKGTISDGGA